MFRTEGEEPGETTDEERLRAELGYRLLDSWKVMPGTKCRRHRQVEEAVFSSWVDEARRQVASAGRQKIGDQQVGRLLRYAPDDEDGAWPHRAVRDLIDGLASEHLERGVEIEIRNSRGVTSRGLTDGGDQERALAAKYRGFAKVVANAWPRTGALLRRVANSYIREAQSYDLEAELTEDRWR